MAGKSKVPLFQAPQRFVTIEPGATVGATFGVDLRWPNGALVKEADFSAAPSEPDSPVSRTLWSLVYEIPPNVTALEVATGTGLFVVTGSKTGVFRAIDAVDGELTVENANAVDDNPLLGLADVPDSGGGTLQKTDFDAKGRKTGTSAATTDDLPEGDDNLYFTNARADARIEVAKADPDGIASLVDGKLDPGQLPALAITETFVVADEAAMLALDCQQGDVAVRSDEQKSYILTAEPASTLSNWQELLVPTGVGVASFNGRTGSVVPASGDYTPAQVGAEPAITGGTTVQYWRGDKSWQTLNKAAVGLANVDNTSDSGKPVSTAQQTALDAKLPIAPTAATDFNSCISTGIAAFAIAGNATNGPPGQGSNTASVLYLPGVTTTGTQIYSYRGSAGSVGQEQLWIRNRTGSTTFNGWCRVYPAQEPNNVINGDFTLDASMVGTAVGKNNATANNVTVPINVFAAGDSVKVRNANTSGDTTLVRAVGLNMFLAGNTTVAYRTLAPRGYAIIEFTSPTVCYVSGYGVS